MENKPRMMTIREIASTGLLSEHAKRRKAPGYLYREKGTN